MSNTEAIENRKPVDTYTFGPLTVELFKYNGQVNLDEWQREANAFTVEVCNGNLTASARPKDQQQYSRPHRW